MIVSSARIEAQNIHDPESFHHEFDRVFGFPGFYGQNLNAWIDCMTSLDCEDDAMSTIHVKPGGVLALEIANVKHLKEKCPQQYDDLIECSAFVNWRRIERGDGPVLALSFNL